MGKIVSAVKAQAVALALGRVTGYTPLVARVGDRARVYWSNDDLPHVRAWLRQHASRVASGPPSDVYIDLVPVVQPYVMQSVIPAVLITLAVGVVLGRL